MTAALLALNARTFASLKRHRNYRLFFTGQVISVSGTWMQNVALAWLVVELTHSPLAVGILAFCRFIPFTVFGLFAGVVADRIDNRKLVIGTQIVSMIFSALFAVLVLGGLETLWVVYLLAILSSTALVFDAPGRHALTFQMVGREELPNAVALNASLFNASRVVGPAVAGVLIAAFGVGVCFAINAVTFLAVLVGLLMMRKEELVPVERSAEPPTMMRGIREGFAWALHAPHMRLVLAIVTVVSTVGFNFHADLRELPRDAQRRARVIDERARVEVRNLEACAGARNLDARDGALDAARRAAQRALLLPAFPFQFEEHRHELAEARDSEGARERQLLVAPGEAAARIELARRDGVRSPARRAAARAAEVELDRLLLADLDGDDLEGLRERLRRHRVFGRSRLLDGEAPVGAAPDLNAVAARVARAREGGDDRVLLGRSPRPAPAALRRARAGSPYTCASRATTRKGSSTFPYCPAARTFIPSPPAGRRASGVRDAAGVAAVGVAAPTVFVSGAVA